jgi:histidinol-phosphate aminotransferase
MPKNIRDLVAYESARSLNTKGEIFLDANELPWAYEDKAFNRYPTPNPRELLKLMADYYKISSDEIILGRGSDEAIDNLVRCFCEAGKNSIMTCPPTYGMYDICAKIQNVKNIEIPLVDKNGQSFHLNTDEIIERIDETVRLIFLCSPNNPTGNILNKDCLFKIVLRYQMKLIIILILLS